MTNSITHNDIQLISPDSFYFTKLNEGCYNFKYDGIEVNIYEYDNKVIIENIKNKRGNTDFVRMMYTQYKENTAELNKQLNEALITRLNNFSNKYNVTLENIQLTKKDGQFKLFANVLMYNNELGYDKKVGYLIFDTDMNIIEVSRRAKQQLLNIVEASKKDSTIKNIEREEIATTTTINNDETTNVKNLYNELKELNKTGNDVYDLILERGNELNKQGIRVVDYNKDNEYKQFNSKLDNIELQETKLKKLYIEATKKEYTIKCNLLKEEYKDNRYKAVYNNNEIHYYKHRKDILKDNLISIFELQTNNKCYQEVTVYSINNSIEYIDYYKKNHILALLEKVKKVNGKITEHYVYRKDFKYYLFNSVMSFKFNIDSITTIEYLHNLKDNKTTIQMQIGSMMHNWIYVNTIQKEDMDKINNIINRYSKDKHIKDIIETFTIKI